MGLTIIRRLRDQTDFLSLASRTERRDVEKETESSILDIPSSMSRTVAAPGVNANEAALCCICPDCGWLTQIGFCLTSDEKLSGWKMNLSTP